MILMGLLGGSEIYLIEGLDWLVKLSQSNVSFYHLKTCKLG